MNHNCANWGEEINIKLLRSYLIGFLNCTPHRGLSILYYVYDRISSFTMLFLSLFHSPGVILHILCTIL